MNQEQRTSEQKHTTAEHDTVHDHSRDHVLVHPLREVAAPLPAVTPLLDRTEAAPAHDPPVAEVPEQILELVDMQEPLQQLVEVDHGPDRGHDLVLLAEARLVHARDRPVLAHLLAQDHLIHHDPGRDLAHQDLVHAPARVLLFAPPVERVLFVDK
jgi:hypothetical protein